jgi:hypothetical protein
VRRKEVRKKGKKMDRSFESGLAGIESPPEGQKI